MVSVFRVSSDLVARPATPSPAPVTGTRERLLTGRSSGGRTAQIQHGRLVVPGG